MPHRHVARHDVVSLGELVIDLVPTSLDREPLFAARPGGAPGNVAAGVARLGRSAAMLSRVGPGAFGQLLIDALERAGVDTAAVTRSAHEPTALAVVSLHPDGDRDFVLYREACADSRLVLDLPAPDYLAATRVLHTGSLSLATPVSAAAQRAAVAQAGKAGALISTDVNFRPALWRDPAAMLATGREAVAAANIVKVSADELFALTGANDIAAAALVLWHPRLRLLAVTAGAGGASLFTADGRIDIAGFAVPVLDTVGCGDAFMAALLVGLLAAGSPVPDARTLERIGRYASAAGAVMAGVAGAMENMPRHDQIVALLRTHGFEAPPGLKTGP
jgi:fructokinase